MTAVWSRELGRPPLVGEELPSRLSPLDMQAIFEVKAARFYELLAAGKFDRFEHKPVIGHRTFSGKKLRAYLDQDGAFERATWQPRGLQKAG